ncbi:MAG: 4-hydroxybenzoate octaprenyltransferase [Alphaproteobacteria bacterium]
MSLSPDSQPLTPDSTAPGLLRWLPRAWRPYARLARLDRPIGTWLLLFPCWWGLALAGTGDHGADGLLWLGVIFAVGAVVMRGAGCTINDILDRDFDAKVARTAQRPIPSGAVSVRAAWIFLAGELLVGLAVLLALHPFAWALGVASLALVFTYPLMKRVTYWPQAVLGLAFNWGALMGYAAATGTLAWSAVLLYTAGICWTLGYDTIYAHQDKDDDALIGVKSTALKFGAATRPWLFGFYAATILLAALAGAREGLAWPFYALLAVAGAQLLWQAAKVDIDDAADCLAKFRSNRWFGWLLLAALIAGQAL